MMIFVFLPTVGYASDKWHCASVFYSNKESSMNLISVFKPKEYTKESIKDKIRDYNRNNPTNMLNIDDESIAKRMVTEQFREQLISDERMSLIEIKKGSSEESSPYKYYYVDDWLRDTKITFINEAEPANKSRSIPNPENENLTPYKHYKTANGDYKKVWFMHEGKTLCRNEAFSDYEKDKRIVTEKPTRDPAKEPSGEVSASKDDAEEAEIDDRKHNHKEHRHFLAEDESDASPRANSYLDDDEKRRDKARHKDKNENSGDWIVPAALGGIGGAVIGTVLSNNKAKKAQKERCAKGQAEGVSQEDLIKMGCKILTNESENND